jgi:VanZ family protein
VEYFVLGTLLCRAVAGGFGRRLSVASALLVIALGVSWGVSDEWHQSFVPRRDSSATDVLKDLAGCLLAALAWRALTASDSRRESEAA